MQQIRLEDFNISEKPISRAPLNFETNGVSSCCLTMKLTANAMFYLGILNKYTTRNTSKAHDVTCKKSRICIKKSLFNITMSMWLNRKLVIASFILNFLNRIYRFKGAQKFKI